MTTCLRSRDRVPLMNTLLGPNDGAGRSRTAQDWVECGEWIRELRPHIDLYLLTDESIAAGNEGEPDVYDRTFYRLNDVTDLHSTVIAGMRNRFSTPFFDALRAYAGAPVGQFHALPIARGASIFNSKSLQDMGEFYGRNIFMAETSTTSGGLDSLLDPHGNIKKAMDKAAKTWNADHTYFVTNGTSTANKIVVQSLTRPGDIVLIDRNCHKSHHYGLVLAGAYPLYLDAYPLPQFAIYGAVPLSTIKKALLDLEAAGQLDRVRMLLLTNCIFDGVVYNPRRVMEEVLAIKPDICFLWDEAWYAFATAVPWARQRTAMVSADRLERTLASPEYAEEYRNWAASMEGIPRSEWVNHRLLPDPSQARVRVYATHSTHKSLSAFRQASMIHVRDQDFNSRARDAFGEAFLTHTSTSPNQQLLASLDLARRQVDMEGFQLVRQVYDMALVFRHRVRKDRLISKWFRILDESDLVPEEFRASAVSSYREVRQGALAEWNEAWRSDQFVLDPTRVTLFLGNTGMNGYDFREKILMDRFGIQINKTSINSVLLIFTIGVTWSSVHHLLDVLRRVATDFDREKQAASAADWALHERRVEEITEDLPHLPDFSEFDIAFRPVDDCSFGDMRAAFYAGYEEADREYVQIGMAGRRLAEGKRLVSTTFVVPYPPGFPVLVPGQVVSKEIRLFPGPARCQGNPRLQPRPRVVGVHPKRAGEAGSATQCGDGRGRVRVPALRDPGGCLGPERRQGREGCRRRLIAWRLGCPRGQRRTCTDGDSYRRVAAIDARSVGWGSVREAVFRSPGSERRRGGLGGAIANGTLFQLVVAEFGPAQYGAHRSVPGRGPPEYLLTCISVTAWLYPYLSENLAPTVRGGPPTCCGSRSTPAPTPTDCRRRTTWPPNSSSPATPFAKRSPS